MSTGQMVPLTDGPFDILGIEVIVYDLKRQRLESSFRGPLAVFQKVLSSLLGTWSQTPRGFVEIVGLDGLSKPSVNTVASELRRGLMEARGYRPYQLNGSELAKLDIRMLYAHKCGDNPESAHVTSVYYTSYTAYQDAVAELNTLTRNRVLEIQVHDGLMSIKSLTTPAQRA